MAPERLCIESECLVGLIPPNQSADMDCSGKSLTLHGITEMISEGVRTEGRLLAALLTAGAKSIPKIGCWVQSTISTTAAVSNVLHSFLNF